MLNIVWEFHVKSGKDTGFERHYCGSGAWAEFFSQDPGYQKTLLIRDRENPAHYLTVDI